MVFAAQPRYFHSQVELFSMNATETQLKHIGKWKYSGSLNPQEVQNHWEGKGCQQVLQEQEPETMTLMDFPSLPIASPHRLPSVSLHAVKQFPWTKEHGSGWLSNLCHQRASDGCAQFFGPQFRTPEGGCYCPSGNEVPGGPSNHPAKGVPCKHHWASIETQRRNRSKPWTVS